MKRNYENRKRLEEIIPIDTPMVVYIEPTNLCNFRCSFCPTSDKELLKKANRPSGTMTYQTLKKIVDDFKKFPSKIKKIHFYINGEPLLNKDLTKMITYAKENKISEELWIKTNGSLLTHEVSNDLIKSGLDFIGISIEGVTKERYKEICDVDVDYDQIVENVKYLYENRKKCRIYVKIVDYGLTEKEKEKFFDDFHNIASEVKIENLMGWSASGEKDFTLGINPDKTMENEEKKTNNICPYPFYAMAINFNGDVSLCCVDWSLGTVVGNTKEQSLFDIWNGDRLFEFRKMHLKGRRKENGACGDCYSINCHPDNIDKYSEVILEKITAARKNI